MTKRKLRWPALPLVLLFSAGCTHAGLQRAAHDALQQHACESGQPRGTCQRSWQPEYEAWQAQFAEHQAAVKGRKNRVLQSQPLWYQLPTSLVIE